MNGNEIKKKGIYLNFLILILLLTPVSLPAQSALNIDSLKQVLHKAKNASDSVAVFIQLVWQLGETILFTL